MSGANSDSGSWTNDEFVNIDEPFSEIASDQAPSNCKPVFQPLSPSKDLRVKINSVLNTFEDGATIEELSTTYRSQIGEDIPFRDHKFSNLEDMMRFGLATFHKGRWYANRHPSTFCNQKPSIKKQWDNRLLSVCDKSQVESGQARGPRRVFPARRKKSTEVKSGKSFTRDFTTPDGAQKIDNSKVLKNKAASELQVTDHFDKTTLTKLQHEAVTVQEVDCLELNEAHPTVKELLLLLRKTPCGIPFDRLEAVFESVYGRKMEIGEFENIIEFLLANQANFNLNIQLDGSYIVNMAARDRVGLHAIVPVPPYRCFPKDSEKSLQIFYALIDIFESSLIPQYFPRILFGQFGDELLKKTSFPINPLSLGFGNMLELLCSFTSEHVFTRWTLHLASNRRDGLYIFVKNSPVKPSVGKPSDLIFFMDAFGNNDPKQFPNFYLMQAQKPVPYSRWHFVDESELITYVKSFQSKNMSKPERVEVEAFDVENTNVACISSQLSLASPFNDHFLFSVSSNLRSFPEDIVRPDEKYLGPYVMEVGKPYPVYVSHIDDPNHFHLQMISGGFNSKLDYMMDQIAESYQNLKRSIHYSMPEELMVRGSICIAVSPDNNFCRGRIEDGPYHIDNEKQYKVFWVDYGGVNFVPIHAVRFLKHKFLDLPIQALTASLAMGLNVPANGVSWSAEAKEFFFESLKEEEVWCKPRTISADYPPHYEVALWNTNGIADIVFPDIMVHKRFAVSACQSVNDLPETSLRAPASPTLSEKARILALHPPKTASALHAVKIEEVSSLPDTIFSQITPDGPSDYKSPSPIGVATTMFTSSDENGVALCSGLPKSEFSTSFSLENNFFESSTNLSTEKKSSLYIGYADSERNLLSTKAPSVQQNLGPNACAIANDPASGQAPDLLLAHDSEIISSLPVESQSSYPGRYDIAVSADFSANLLEARVREIEGRLFSHSLSFNRSVTGMELVPGSSSPSPPLPWLSGSVNQVDPNLLLNLVAEQSKIISELLKVIARRM